MRLSLCTSIAAAIAFVICVPVFAQQYHPYTEKGFVSVYPTGKRTEEVWASENAVFTSSFDRVKGTSGIQKFWLFDRSTGALIEKRENPLNDPPTTKYTQTVNWNDKTYRLGYEERKEGKGIMIDVVMYAMNDNDLTDQVPRTVIMSAPAKGVQYYDRLIQYRLSPDRSKLLIYVEGLYADKYVQQWWCGVMDADGKVWDRIHSQESKDDRTKDFQVDNQGTAYLLTSDALITMDQTKVDQHAFKLSNEVGLLDGVIHMEANVMQIIGVIAEKDLKEPKLTSMTFDVSNTGLSSPLYSDLPNVNDFEPRDMVIQRSNDGYWLAVFDRGYNSSRSIAINKKLIICRLDGSGSLQWSQQIAKPMMTRLVNDPEVILYPKGDDLIVLFQDSEDNMERRSKGEEPRVLISPEEASVQERYRYTVEMIISSDQQTSMRWLEMDGARCSWRGIQQIDENTFFSGNAVKGEEHGFLYWQY